MSFWDNNDAAARRREEERQKKAAEARQQAKIAKAKRQVALTRQKERRRIRAEQDAEDKKLRDALVEKMTNGGKESKSESTFPGLNRGFGGDRAQPTNYQQCFQHLKKPGEAGARSAAAPADDGGGEKGGSGVAERSLPPLKRPF